MTGKNNSITAGFSVCGALLVISFAAVVNYITGPLYPWFIYPLFAVIWWPLSMVVPRRYGAKGFSVLGSALTTGFLCAVNYISTPDYPWILFALPVLLLWPILVYSGKAAGKVPFAVLTGIFTAFYYVVLNLTIAKGFPWCVFVIYGLVWWPLSLIFYGKGRAFGFSVFGTVLTSILFYILNMVTTPQNIWFIYPVFALVWWPLSLYFFGDKKSNYGFRA